MKKTSDELGGDRKNGRSNVCGGSNAADDCNCRKISRKRKYRKIPKVHKRYREEKIMQLKSQKMRKLAPELDPLRIGTGWTKEDLGKVQVIVESTYGDSHPGSGHLNILEEEVRKGIAEEGGFGARYHCTDICDGESQGTDGINYSLASREMIANMIEIHANATPFDAGVYLSSCDKGVPGNLIGLARVDIPSVFVPGGTMNAGPEMLTLEQLGMYSAKFERGEIDEEN